MRREKRWSRLQKKLYEIIDPTLNFQIHLTIYRMQSQRGSTDSPRYWITLNQEIIFDYPAQFMNPEGFVQNLSGETTYYPYGNDISAIFALIEEYLNTPREQVFTKHFENDFWGLVNILKSADRRTGRRRLLLLKKERIIRRHRR
ncbi:MAG: hypothetical protein IJ644_10330 [Oscillospiraceae bacterium]|nr:hypothetical protein [Oscillospiraceae bacterium]